MRRRIVWTFNGGKPCALELDSRVLRCYDQDGSVAWVNRFHTRAEAQARLEGDLRAMRRNPCYSWLSDTEEIARTRGN